MSSTQTISLPPALTIATKILDKSSLNQYRTAYMQFRVGKAKGAKGEGSRAVGEPLKSVVVSVERSVADEDNERGSYELAKDVRVDPKIDASCNFEATFERSKLMRSQILVERDLITNLASRALDVIPKKCYRSSLYVITDTVIDKLYGDAVLDGLLSAGLKATKFVVPSDTDVSGETSTEESKSIEIFVDLVDKVIESGVDKRSCIVSLGGGVVNNICGYMAASIYRGISLVHISTSFMGQVDAAIDFKQAINHCCGKNLLGAYYPATKIILDPTVLLTQSIRHRRNGLAEALKHGMVHSTDLLNYIVHGSIEDPAYLDGVVRRTIAVKIPTLTRYSESDFNEMAPQYGHAPAHAIEFLSWHNGCPKHGVLLHGEAVAIGMCVSAEVAYLMGVCAKDVVDDHYRLVQAAGLPSCTPAEMDIDKIISKLSYDKHTLSGKPTMGLLVAVGQMYQKNGVYGQPISPDVLRRAFQINMKRGAGL